MKNVRLQGFTLLEVTIVLVIIGTLIGTVIAAQAIITNSRLQTVLTDVDSYITAANNFRQTYQGLPGDFYNAAVVWGTDSNGCSMGGTGNSGGGTSGTCGGSGSGTLLNTDRSGTLNAASEAGETFLFWQHLYLAGMFTQKLSNTAGTGGPYDSAIGTNVPGGPVRGSGYSVLWVGLVSSGSTYFYPSSSTQSYGNVIFFGAQYSGNETLGPILTADQAAALDSKIDDGLPGTGKVFSMVKSSTYTPSCATTANPSTAAYNVSSTSGNICSLIFVTGF